MGHLHCKVKGPITEKVVIKDLVEVCPEAVDIIKKHLGENCLSFPGSQTETIEFLAAMNDSHPYALLDELNETCKTPPKKTGHF
ncbi:MAG TPA: hypothetical protein ENJ37_07890 [Deltaproteobacteria bacterium]|nr:hypothetical protein [Deltaproteobacteria bacterium]